MSIPTQRYTRDDWIGNSFGFWLSAVFFLLIGTVVSILKPGDRIAQTHFAFCLSGTLMHLGIYDATTTFYLPSWSNIVVRLFLGISAMTLVMFFPRQLTRWPYSRIVGLLSFLGLVILLLSLSNYPIPSARPWSHLGPAMFAFLGNLAVILVPIWSAVSKTSSQKEKGQAKIIVGGAVLSLAPMLLLLIGPLTHNESPLLNIGSLFGFILPLAIAYAIVRHQLFEIDILLRPSLTYTLLSALLVALYTAVLSIASVHFGSHSWLPNLLATILVALTFAPARDRIKAWLDHQFFRSSYDPDAVRAAFTTAAQQVSDRAGLLAAFSTLVEETFHPTSMVVYLRPSGDAPTEGVAVAAMNNEGGPTEARDALDFPLAVREQTIGHVRIGPKRSDTLYSETDLGLLNSLIDQLTIWLSLFDRIDQVQAHVRQLEAMHEAKALQDQFLSTVSHELRTPVAVILASMSVLQHSGQDERLSLLATYLDRIHRNAKQLSILLDDLLNAGQIQSGLFTLSLRPIDPRGLVETAVSDLHALAVEKRKQLLVGPTLEGMEIAGDAQRLGQALRNLLINAIKHTPEGSTIVASVLRHDQGIRFAIKDDGAGIASEDQTKLFERFSRLTNNSDVSDGGVGLGLYIVKVIVTGHGGEVGVESTPGNGATFWFTLPHVPAEQSLGIAKA